MRVLGYILSFVLLIASGVSIGSDGMSFSPIVGILVAFVMLYYLNRGAKSKKTLKLKWEAKSGNEELDKLNEEVFEKALNDFNALENERQGLKDKELNQQLVKMQGIAANFLRYLQEHPEKVGLARRFVDYYQDRALLLLRKFKELEKTQLHTQEIEDTKQKIKDVLDSFDEAYEDQFSKVLNAQMMDLDAELKVMKQTLESDGIQAEEEPPQLSKSSPQEDAGKVFWRDLLQDTKNLFTQPDKKKR